MTAPVAPIDAATVIVVRHGVPLGEPWQVYMVRRPAQSDFAADVYVFPGGKVDAQDRDPILRDLVDEHPAPENEPEGPEQWRAIRLAAIRELFEEAGILLARRPNDGLVRLTAEEGERFGQYREALRSGGMTLTDLARQEDLRYTLDRLHSLSRWITPQSFPKRFDTRFFVAYQPEHQSPAHAPDEITQGEWISPRVALERFRHGDFPLVFATEKHLERLAEYPSIEGMIAATAEADLEPVMPKPVTRDGHEEFLLPRDSGYAEA